MILPVIPFTANWARSASWCQIDHIECRYNLDILSANEIASYATVNGRDDDLFTGVEKDASKGTSSLLTFFRFPCSDFVWLGVQRIVDHEAYFESFFLFPMTSLVRLYHPGNFLRSKMQDHQSAWLKRRTALDTQPDSNASVYIRANTRGECEECEYDSVKMYLPR